MPSKISYILIFLLCVKFFPEVHDHGSPQLPDFLLVLIICQPLLLLCSCFSNPVKQINRLLFAFILFLWVLNFLGSLSSLYPRNFTSFCLIVSMFPYNFLLFTTFFRLTTCLSLQVSSKGRFSSLHCHIRDYIWHSNSLFFSLFLLKAFFLCHNTGFIFWKAPFLVHMRFHISASHFPSSFTTLSRELNFVPA